ncbi:MAG: VCBS repeat-containing protein, partial [Planctomycetes bacterium]|nr:VCBS repeat-containing protein [Planctomycetota bacterium]
MTVLLVLPAVLATLFMSACDSAPRCELRLATREWQANDCRAADADGDGIDELLILDEASISARNLDLTFDWQVPSPIPDEARCHLFPRSAGRESSPQFAITASVPESLLLFMSGRRSVLDCRRQPRNSRATWDVDFLGADSADLNADGENDLVVSIGSGYAWPWLGRGVYAVDGRTSRLLWRYGLGPVPHAPVIADVNRDGQPEILISTGAVGNGCIENGTADTCAYVLCLDGLGRQLWSRPVRFGSGAWTEVEAADLDGDGRPEVFTVENSCVADSTMGSIMLLNPDDGSILARRQVDSIQGCHVVGDLDADGRQEIVTSTRNGVVTVRGLGLEPIRSVPLSDGIDWVGACDHLLGTKQRQFAVVTQAGALKVLDHRLRTLATISLSRIVEEVRPVHTGTNTPMGLLVATAPYLRGSYQDNWILLRLHILRNPFPWAVLTGILAVLLA